ncbi:Rgg/GadR/MutR family transcriptional regulator [Staphylococcus lutrae]|uniref:MutR family transcriptional regulator n=1 Tax=Staphylococcus lutrae TaxID=155085 RepID=A0AAC9RQF7_9STAP|nr:Rgg/GadR/MutR family transcriptional regulator [Staphylococcus lutrae]ARJ51891.1 MutR family transcriptional regulator [Staphylococcus lutrae]PNZ35954.1 MutR family transcriptional regulator [Staphylococcus lutrae]
MEHFGKIFKIFRESRGFKLKDIAEEGISISQLSRFEHEKTDLTIGKFILALNNMNMSIEEFMYVMSDCHLNQLNETLLKLNQLISNKDIEGMKQLLIHTSTNHVSPPYNQKLNSILIKSKLQQVTQTLCLLDEDVRYLTDYLFKIEFWGYYELLIFANTFEVLNHRTFIMLSKELCKRSDFYSAIPANRQLIAHMLLNAYLTCIKRNEWLDALYFKTQIKVYNFNETEVYERLMFHFASNLYDYKKYQCTQAILEMEKCITTLKMISCLHLASQLENELKSATTT